MTSSLSDALLDDADVRLPRDSHSPDGEVDMYEAALADSDPATALARLRGHGFVTGALRSWTDGERIAQVTLHRLRSPRDAELAAAEQVHALIAAAAVPFPVDLGDPACFGGSVADPHADPPFVAHVVVRPIGTVMMLVLLGGGGATPDEVVDLARMQSDRLGTGGSTDGTEASTGVG